MKLRTPMTRALTAVVVVGATVGVQALAASPASATRSSAACANVIQIVARGSNEPAGSGSGALYTTGGWGRMGGLADNVAVKSGKTVRTAGLNYPAQIAPNGNLTKYLASEMTGRIRLAGELNRLAKACPSSKTVLIGYSQGAHVIGDVVSNGNPQGLTSSAKSKIAAIFLTGDPVRRYGEPFNRGTGTGGGLLANRWPGDLSGVQSRLISYCYKGDVFCDFAHVSLTQGVTIHESYGNTEVRNYGTSFILGKIG